MNIAFLGLGVMGQSMARHILSKHGSLIVWNRTPEKTALLVEEGAELAKSPAEAGATADLICLCLSNTEAVEEVTFGNHGIWGSLREGQLIIDFSTISAVKTEEIAHRVNRKGVRWVDAPISGGDVGAKNATLSIMFGAEEIDVERAALIFSMVGKNWNHMGPVGNGQRTKLANQIAVVGSLAAMGEALVYAKESGLQPEKVLSAISAGAAGSWSLSNYGPRILAGDFAPGFSSALQAKDLRLVMEEIEKLPSSYDVTRHLHELFSKMEELQMSDEGNHAVVKLMGWKDS